MPTSRYTVSPSLAPAALAGGAVLAIGALAWPYTVDDAFIVARYARNLAAGAGYAMNPQKTSDGVTGPLWLVPQWLAIVVGLEPIAVAKAIGLGASALAAAQIVVRLSARSGGVALAWVAASVCALSPSIATWGVSGLETGVTTWLTTQATLSATARRAVRAWALGACVALLAWLRPELAPACGVLLGASWLRDRRAGAIALGLALAGSIAVVAFRMTWFGHALPMSWDAKAGTLADGVEYALRSVLLSTSGFGAALAARGASIGRRDDRVVGGALLVHACAVVLAGGDWMPGYRLLVPALPLYAWLVAVGVARGARGRTWPRAVLLSLALVVPALDLATRVPELRAAGASQARSLELAAWLRSNARSVALVDVGLLGYASGLPVLDLGGLTDPDVAALPGGHLDKRLDASFFSARAPDAIVLHASRPPRVSDHGELLALDGYPVERRVASLPEVRARYRVVHRHLHAPGYHYVVLKRLPER